jgi:hypothetical protein
VEEIKPEENRFQKKVSFINAGTEEDNVIDLPQQQHTETKQELAVTQESEVQVEDVEVKVDEVTIDKNVEPKRHVETVDGILRIKANKKEEKTYNSFYLRKDTLRRLNKLSKKTGVKQSPLLDQLLSEIFDKMGIK